MGVYRLAYPGQTSKKIIIVICKFVTFSLLKRGWDSEACIANNIQLLRCGLLIFFGRRREQMDITEGGPIKRNSWKPG